MGGPFSPHLGPPPPALLLPYRLGPTRAWQGDWAASRAPVTSLSPHPIPQLGVLRWDREALGTFGVTRPAPTPTRNEPRPFTCCTQRPHASLPAAPCRPPQAPPQPREGPPLPSQGLDAVVRWSKQKNHGGLWVPQEQPCPEQGFRAPNSPQEGRLCQAWAPTTESHHCRVGTGDLGK